jgi:hypothetical protein
MADMLPAIGGAAFRRFGFVQSSIISRWPEIVGARYAKASAPESLRFPQGKRSDGVLSIVVTSASAPMMQHVVPTIIERVNRFFGYPAVARVTMRQGEVARVQPVVRPVALEPVSAEVSDSLRPIADPELRAVLESLAQGVAAKASFEILGKVK